MDFLKKLNNIINKNNSLLCIGLDTDKGKIPKHLLKTNYPIFEFNKIIIDATYNLICSYKLNIAYYEAVGIKGLESLKKTVEYLQKNYPNIPVICDAKRGDIGPTSQQYAKALFDYYRFDAATVNPYLGFDAIEPYLQHKDKGIIILCRTSNPSASDFQDLIVVHLGGGNEAPPRKFNERLYVKVAEKIIEWNNKYKNCLMVIGATWPEELGRIRKMAKNMFFLVPGVGTQEGDLKNTLKLGLTKEKSGLIIHVARAIIYAGNGRDFAKKAQEKAEEIKDKINNYR